MSLAGALSHVCVQLDPVNNTCTTRHILCKRSLSTPVKRHRPFSSPRRSGSCVLVNAQARPIALAATVVAETVRTANQQASTSSSSADDRLRQLEASYKAQSAAELSHIEMQPQNSSDTEGTFTQLERSWQAQAEASTSGRSIGPQSASSFAARFPSRKSNLRSNRRSSRLYAASTRRNQLQHQGVARPPQQTITGCPDTQFCTAIGARLKKEKHTRRISRSEHLQLHLPSTPLHKLQLYLCSPQPICICSNIPEPVIPHLDWHACVSTGGTASFASLSAHQNCAVFETLAAAAAQLWSRPTVHSATLVPHLCLTSNPCLWLTS